jgi:hypothetical protein
VPYWPEKSVVGQQLERPPAAVALLKGRRRLTTRNELSNGPFFACSRRKEDRKAAKNSAGIKGKFFHHAYMQPIIPRDGFARDLKGILIYTSVNSSYIYLQLFFPLQVSLHTLKISRPNRHVPVSPTCFIPTSFARNGFYCSHFLSSPS